MDGVCVEGGVWGVIVAGQAWQKSRRVESLLFILRDLLREGESLPVDG